MQSLRSRVLIASVLSVALSMQAGQAGAAPSCRLDAVSATEYEACLRQWIDHVLTEARQSPVGEPPKAFVELVAERQCVEHEFLQRSLERGKTVVPTLVTALGKHNLPTVLHYVSLIESGYQTTATSAIGTTGPWQFNAETARRYGLVVDDTRDDRRDLEKSTGAAIAYLQDLLFDFGTEQPLLTLSSYNLGESGVRKTLRQLDDPYADRSYWKLFESGKLPKEVACYGARFAAGATAGEGGLATPQVIEQFLGRACSNTSCGPVTLPGTP